MPDTLLGGIAINEVLVDPNGTINYDTDGSGVAESTDEYIELVNTSNVAIDISGLELWDAGVGNWFTFPAGTILQPGAHAMVITGVSAGGSLPTGDPDDLFFDAGRGAALINNGGDNVVVYDPTNDEFIQATFNGDALDDPTLGAGGYAGFSATATRNGSGEDFGNDTDGLSLQRQYDTADTFVSAGPTPGTTNVCFANGTFVTTDRGRIPVEELTAEDRVETLDNGFRRVRWMFKRVWQARDLIQDPLLAPIVIANGALGNGLPTAPVRVSRQHRVLVRSKIAKRMFGQSEVLLPACKLLGLPGIQVDLEAGRTTYCHIMLESHDVLNVDGIGAESLYLGEQALKSIPPVAIGELEVILGMPVADMMNKAPRQARTFVERNRARRLIFRHAKNRKPFMCRESQAA